MEWQIFIAKKKAFNLNAFLSATEIRSIFFVISNRIIGEFVEFIEIIFNSEFV
jgi:hypothetical protein